MTWKPLSRQELESLMEEGLAEAGDLLRTAWERIRVEPRKWLCSPWGDEGGGFWVVAEMGDQVVWFNDIEDGFNISAFTTPGVIDEYNCNQQSFGDFLRSLPEARVAEEFAQSAPTSSVPWNARGRGRIEHRQTTYWDARPEGGSTIRIHFTDKVESRFAGPEYEGIEIKDTHPLLVHYQESWLSLFVNGLQGCRPSFAEALTREVDTATQGWRDLREYVGGADRARLVLRDGYGLLLRAPESLARSAAEIVRAHGAEPSLLPHRKARPGYVVLLFGRAFVVARAFRFEPKQTH
jgi:hypothetical protein